MKEASGNDFPKGLELAAALHVSLFLIGVTWAFGGNADWVRTPISIWGSLGILITLASILPGRRHARFRGTLLWSLPLVGLNILVALSCLTPGLRYLSYQGGSFITGAHVPWWRPSTSDTGLSLSSLWLFDGLYFSSLNIALLIWRRRVIRKILGVAAVNAFALSVFGTVQKLVDANGIYFGSVKSPQTYFFASFVYDNHWGAFMILMIGSCTGLVLRYSRGSRGGGFFKGPALAGIVAVTIMAITVPFSGSRACTALLAILLLVTASRVLPSWIRRVRHDGPESAGTIGVVVAIFVLGAAGLWYVAGDVIEVRVAKTRDQVQQMHLQGSPGSRPILYGDTIAMAKARPAFGWGMGTFPRVFSLFNTQVSPIDHIPVVYHDAHSDWLQSVSEIGLVGTILIGLGVLLPLRSAFGALSGSITTSSLTGCALVAAYAWVEFPFGNVAVVLAWWLTYFAAIQYLRISATILPEGARR
ncbi:MAG TPA: O-antigen ligase family protein [Opitutaceae bacterium]|nr:O-antigen ligase family protein [Opitutaceae bacterium]